MLPRCDQIAVHLETGSGLFSIEAHEAAERKLRKMYISIQKYGLNSSDIPYRLKHLVKKFFGKKRLNGKG